ncbi:MAG: hypothetical protein ACYCTB_09335 [bacterium]
MEENLQETEDIKNLKPANTDNKAIVVYTDKEALAQAIEEGIDKSLEDILIHFKQQTKIFTFALLGILAMLAVIALVLASFHNMPLR